MFIDFFSFYVHLDNEFGRFIYFLTCLYIKLLNVCLSFYVVIEYFMQSFSIPGILLKLKNIVKPQGVGNKNINVGEQGGCQVNCQNTNWSLQAILWLLFSSPVIFNCNFSFLPISLFPFYGLLLAYLSSI